MFLFIRAIAFNKTVINMTVIKTHIEMALPKVDGLVNSKMKKK